ncbi:hypothetical protein GJ496_009137 [Pomphorhynchus laevis]|nr:hypothetical protein GJ496_009137 [Pomphorhynchus laevis]
MLNGRLFSINPDLLISLAVLTDHDDMVEQKWYPDDVSCVGISEDLVGVLNLVQKIGPEIGQKIILCKKDDKGTAQIFSTQSVQITKNGVEVLDSLIGTEAFVESWIMNKGKEWIHLVERLSEVRKLNPQAAYCAYINACQHKWRYILRTCHCDGKWLFDLDKCVCERFFPKLQDKMK